MTFVKLEMFTRSSMSSRVRERVSDVETDSEKESDSDFEVDKDSEDESDLEKVTESDFEREGEFRDGVSVMDLDKI